MIQKGGVQGVIKTTLFYTKQFNVFFQFSVISIFYFSELDIEEFILGALNEEITGKNETYIDDLFTTQTANEETDFNHT